MLRVHEGLLALQTLRRPTYLKDVDFGPSRTTISAKERKMSAALVEQFSGDFDPEQITDEYQEQLRELVDAKLEEGDAVTTEATFGENVVGDREALVHDEEDIRFHEEGVPLDDVCIGDCLCSGTVWGSSRGITTVSIGDVVVPPVAGDSPEMPDTA